MIGLLVFLALIACTLAVRQARSRRGSGDVGTPPVVVQPWAPESRDHHRLPRSLFRGHGGSM